MPRPESAEAHAEADFLRTTAEHEMTILLDENVYRHVRFKQPGTIVYYYDLITWPGHLCCSGDCGTFVFSRIDDMFAFFTSSGINPMYWSEKLRAPSYESARRYDPDLLNPWLDEWAEQMVEYHDLNVTAAGELQTALQRVLDDERVAHSSSRDLALSALSEFQVDLDGRIIYIDPMDFPDLTDWDHQFLWSCWAIKHGIARYNEAKAARKEVGTG